MVPESHAAKLLRRHPWLWIPIGIALACVIAVALFVGIQLAVWGNSAPDWYIVPDLLGSMVIGSLGWMWGWNRAERSG